MLKPIAGYDCRAVLQRFRQTRMREDESVCQKN